MLGRRALLLVVAACGKSSSGDTVATAHRIGVAHPAFSNYVGKRAEGYARLAAFRLHLELDRAGRCLTEAELGARLRPPARAVCPR